MRSRHFGEVGVPCAVNEQLGLDVIKAVFAAERHSIGAVLSLDSAQHRVIFQDSTRLCQPFVRDAGEDHRIDGDMEHCMRHRRRIQLEKVLWQGISAFPPGLQYQVPADAGDDLPFPGVEYPGEIHAACCCRTAA